MLKRELVRGIVISNTCVKLYRNWIINEVARAGEHTNERTYVRTYSHTYVRDRPYIPSTTLLCEGITNSNVFSLTFLHARRMEQPIRTTHSPVHTQSMVTMAKENVKRVLLHVPGVQFAVVLTGGHG